ncbi:efflux RND transporter periplasmic adaptor subunit [Litoreibacter roseus]|uniref:MexE family multidrug efflux RND transporter periplasmic adaptor subunit n=1 Tax=Litoreibacter roseus TaxID=2601869 RepID=A0A6N6JFZ0_9RHOB|nr:efflux RND transporter periplasmic adaptor subunit [Litoreibacter roseus]GFE64208.1 MexE family multidrug efflux RND transporter periplasmic adaptor subunit [Litoreibacter roseus]
MNFPALTLNSISRIAGPITALAIAAFAGAGHAQSQQPPVVKVAEPLQDTVMDWDVYTGRFQAENRVVLQARVSGYLSAIHFEEGGIVEQGQLLYEIDDRPFTLAVRQAQASLDSARAAVELAEIEFDRATELVARNVGAQSEADSARAQFREATASVAIAEAQLATAELDLEFTQITSPLTGRISSNDVDVGNLVIGGPSGATVLSNIVSVDPIEFVFTVSEADFLKYARLFENGERPSSRSSANQVYVQLMDEDTWNRGGSMTFVDNQLDPNSGTLLGRATLDNPDGFLQPGVFGRLRLPGSGEYDALLIPDEAIVADQARSIVYVVGADDIVEQKGVTRGPMWRGMRVIQTGLEAGDRVIISGIQRARPGSPVTPEPEEITLSEAE